LGKIHGEYLALFAAGAGNILCTSGRVPNELTSALNVIDLSVPESPRVSCNVALEVEDDPSAIAMTSGRVYVAASRRRKDNDGKWIGVMPIYVFNLKDISHPQKSVTFESSGDAIALAAAKNTLYLLRKHMQYGNDTVTTLRAEFVSIDLSNPKLPTEQTALEVD